MSIHWKTLGGFEIGALCKYSNNCGQKSEVFGIDDIIIHPDFDPITYSNDFALVKLDGTSNQTVAKIDDRKISESYESMESKSDLWTMGFGLMAANLHYLPIFLQHVEVDYKRNEDCSISMYQYEFSGETMMCAAGQNKDACSGDSGKFYTFKTKLDFTV